MQITKQTQNRYETDTKNNKKDTKHTNQPTKHQIQTTQIQNRYQDRYKDIRQT